MRRALPFRLLVPKCFIARFSGKLLWLIVSGSKEEYEYRAGKGALSPFASWYEHHKSIHYLSSTLLARLIIPYCSFGAMPVITILDRETRMTTSNFLWQYAICTGVGTFIVCLLGVNMPMAQTSPTEEETAPPITSAPPDIPQGDNGIDYKNAKPIPMPSLPDSPPSDNLPAPPSSGESEGPPGSAPGCTGTGKKAPQVVIPPHPA